jgi:hypothetical protein
MPRRRGRIRTCNPRFQRPSCCQLHHSPIPCGLCGRDGHGLRAQSPAGHPPPVPEETDIARLYATMLCLVCHDKVDAAGSPYHGPLCLPIGRRAGGVSFRAFGGIRTRGLPLRRRTPYPLGHESVVSSAVPTAVHVPDTHRAWNRTTIGIATITRSPPPHPIPGGAAPPTTPLSYQYSRPAACATGSQRFPALDSCPGRIRTCDRTGRNRLL